MTPVRARNKDHKERPSSENRRHQTHSTHQPHSSSSGQVTPGSSMPSTSSGATEELISPDISVLHLDSDDDDSDESDLNPNQSSMSIQDGDTLPIDNASTFSDASSKQLDKTPVPPKALKPLDKSMAVLYLKKKKYERKGKDSGQLRDRDMWRASDAQVMQNLLRGGRDPDDLVKWEAIAAVRGLCTLTDNCTCGDCTRARYLPGVAEGDAGMGSAHLFGPIGFGCSIL